MPDLPWLKLWVEIVDDPKLRSWTDTDRWLWVCLLAIARSHGKGGVIPMDLDGVAWRLRRGHEELDTMVQKAMRADPPMVDMDKDGNLYILNFERRQAGKPSDHPEEVRERVAKHRAVTRYNVTSQSGQSQLQQKDVTRYNGAADDVTRYNGAADQIDAQKEAQDVTRYGVTETRYGVTVTPKREREIKNNINHPPIGFPKTKKATTVPDPYPITDKVLAWATGKGYSVTKAELEAMAETFVNHHKAKGTLYKDWDASYRNWVIRGMDWGWGKAPGGNGGGGGGRQGPPPGNKPVIDPKTSRFNRTVVVQEEDAK
jgi:hypothetical protein